MLHRSISISRYINHTSKSLRRTLSRLQPSQCVTTSSTTATTTATATTTTATRNMPRARSSTNINDNNQTEPLLQQDDFEQQQQDQQQQLHQQQQVKPNTSRLFNHALPAIIILFILSVLVSPYLFSSLPRFLRPTSLSSFLKGDNKLFNHNHPILKSSFISKKDDTRKSIQNGISLISACQDCHSILARSLTSWLKIPQVSEIIIVDWSSSPPLYDTIQTIINVNDPEKMKKLHIVRIDSELNWVYSRAFNLAAKAATNDILLKVDHDIILHPDVVTVHKLTNQYISYYFAGHRSLARSTNDYSFENTVFIQRYMFLLVGGYDERIQFHGYESIDFNERIESQLNCKRFNLSYDYLQHISNSNQYDHVRHQSSLTFSNSFFPYTQTNLNQILLQMISQPWTIYDQSSEYLKLNKHNNNDEENRYSIYKTSSNPSYLESLVNEDTSINLRIQIIKSRLHERYFVPNEIIKNMKIESANKLLSNLDNRNDGLHYDEIMYPNKIPPFAIIHVQNGIGNRLRVLGSGIAFARLTNREPILLWERDVHFGALYEEIFNLSNTNYAVVNELHDEWPLNKLKQEDNTWNKLTYYNYMLDKEEVPSIIDEQDKSIYFKSSSIMNSNITTWEEENKAILELSINSNIQMTVNNALNQLNILSSPSEQIRIGGVHIRNRSLDYDIPNVDDNRELYHNRSIQDIDKWRKVTKMNNFIPTMRSMLNNATVNRFFVTSDSIDVCTQLASIFGDKVISFIDRDCDDRSSQCLNFAMADLLVLAKTKPLLGSTWSSFTEAAMRLGAPKALLAGTDFGEGPDD